MLRFSRLPSWKESLRRSRGAVSQQRLRHKEWQRQGRQEVRWRWPKKQGRRPGRAGCRGYPTLKPDSTDPRVTRKTSTWLSSGPCCWSTRTKSTINKQKVLHFALLRIGATRPVQTQKEAQESVLEAIWFHKQKSSVVCLVVLGIFLEVALLRKQNVTWILFNGWMMNRKWFLLYIYIFHVTWDFSK